MNVGQRVYLKHAPASQGTVSATARGGRFRVTWDNPARKVREPRLRFWYGPEKAGNFLLGHPEA